MISAERCSSCQGVGWRPTSASTLYPDERPCVRCHGEGRVYWRDVEDIEALTSAPPLDGERREVSEG